MVGLVLGNRPTEEQELTALDDSEMVQPGYMDHDPLEGKWPLPIPAPQMPVAAV